MSTREIRDMISTATVGDGDQILNILEKVCDKLDELERDAAAAYSRAGTAVDFARGNTCNNPRHYK